jgi:hypothetical protein
MHVLWPIARRELRLLINDPGMAMISRTSTHEEGSGPVDQCAHRPICGALMVPIQQIENFIQFLVSHLEISERRGVNATPYA